MGHPRGQNGGQKGQKLPDCLKLMIDYWNYVYKMSSLSNKTIYNFLEIEQQNSCKTFFVISLLTVYDIEIIIEVL